MRVQVTLQTRVNHVGRENQRQLSQRGTPLLCRFRGSIHDHDFVRGVQKLARYRLRHSFARELFHCLALIIDVLQITEETTVIPADNNSSTSCQRCAFRLPAGLS